MADELPGFIPHLLRASDVSLLRADERVLEAMLDGWRAQMLARGLAVDTIKSRCSLVRRFVEFTNEYPWCWRPIDVDHFLADLRSQETPIVLSTLRTYSNSIAMFCSYVSDSRYGWAAFCEKQFGDIPSQICFEWNTPQHTTDDALPPKRRAFAKQELQHLFDVIDDSVDQQHQLGSKRWLSALRDSIAFKVCYAFGLRRQQLVMLDLTGFGPNPHVPLYGNYGALTVRWAKGTKGSGPRRRTVLTSPEFAWTVDLLKYWCDEGRHLFATADRSPALWPSERSERLTLSAIGRSFTTIPETRGVAARAQFARPKALLHNTSAGGRLRPALRPATTRSLLCVHDVALHLCVLGLQAESGPADDQSADQDGGAQCLSSDASAFGGIYDR